MKKQIMMGMAVVALLTACNKDRVQPTDQTTAASARGSAVDGFGKGTVITQDQLPQTVRDYLSKTYVGFSFVQGVQGTDRAGATFFAVVIEQGGVRYHLHFDANGALQLGRGGKVGPGPKDANETTITQDKLPAKVQEYLTATYPGYTFGMAQQAADAAGVVLYYEVSITQNGNRIHLNFDATGNLLERKGGRGGKGRRGLKGAGTAIAQDKLPQSVRDYLITNYVNYTFGRAEQVTTRDGVTIYAVMITQGGANYFLLFDADGKFVSVRTKK
jgi:hypothetical protein